MDSQKTTVHLNGSCILAQSEEDGFAIGYFMPKNDGIFKLLLKPASSPPEFHDCCLPESLGEDKHNHNHFGASLSSFLDLSLKQAQQTVLIKNCQLSQPGSDLLSFSTTWTDDVLGRHEDTTGALFETHVVKVDKDAAQIVAKHFPVLSSKACVVNYGVLDLFYS